MQSGETIKGAIVNGLIPTNVLGASGCIPSIINYFYINKRFSIFTSQRFYNENARLVPENVAKPFLSIIPFGGAVLVALAIRLIFEMTPFGTLQNCVDTIITKPFLSFGNNIWVFLFILIVAQVLWFFGIHGTNLVLNTVWQPIAMVAMAANLEAFNAGEPLPYVLTAAFTCFTGQAKLSEIVALCVVGKSKQCKGYK